MKKVAIYFPTSSHFKTVNDSGIESFIIEKLNEKCNVEVIIRDVDNKKDYKEFKVSISQKILEEINN